MVYDEVLAERVRAALPDGPIVEKRMFGGLAFLWNGNLAVSASGRGGGLLVRVGPVEAGDLLAEPGAGEAIMGGRLMKGWLRVDAEAVTGDEALSAWVGRGVAYASTLPAK